MRDRVVHELYQPTGKSAVGILLLRWMKQGKNTVASNTIAHDLGSHFSALLNPKDVGMFATVDYEMRNLHCMRSFLMPESLIKPGDGTMKTIPGYFRLSQEDLTALEQAWQTDCARWRRKIDTVLTTAKDGKHFLEALVITNGIRSSRDLFGRIYEEEGRSGGKGNFENTCNTKLLIGRLPADVVTAVIRHCPKPGLAADAIAGRLAHPQHRRKTEPRQRISEGLAR